MNNFEMLKTKTSLINLSKTLVRYCCTKADKSWQTVVGLEVHAQILSSSKLFSSSSSSSSSTNCNVSIFDASLPGTLPMLNRRCVEIGVMTSLALNCDVNMVSSFDRKHYFYGDMPAGYQITQQRNPLAKNGFLKFFVFTPGVHKSPYIKGVKIKQIQLEQDSGKSLHDTDRSLVDLNRAGVGLMEVVFEPDLSDGEEAAALVKELSAILKKIGACSCKMEDGALRVDANVSVHKQGEPLGTRTEVKNIASVRGVASAIKYEIQRQIKQRKQGHKIINETRMWDANTKSTVAMRDKEQIQDYRYMPEPNLPPLYLSTGNIHKDTVNVDDLRLSLPELPNDVRHRLTTVIGLTREQSIILVSDDVLLKFFEGALKFRELNPNLLANLLIYEFSSVINKLHVDADEFVDKAPAVTDIVYLLETKKINRQICCYLFEEFFKNNPQEPIQIVKDQNLFQITDEEELTKICKSVMEENKKLIDLYRSGKTQVYKVLMKKVVNITNQKANMAMCDVIMKKLLNR